MAEPVKHVTLAEQQCYAVKDLKGTNSKVSKSPDGTGISVFEAKNGQTAVLRENRIKDKTDYSCMVVGGDSVKAFKNDKETTKDYKPEEIKDAVKKAQYLSLLF